MNNKKYLIVIVSMLLGFILYNAFSLQLFLCLKGYSPTHYLLYDTPDYTHSSNKPSSRQKKLLKVFKGSAFKYLYLTPVRMGWWTIIDESSLSISSPYITLWYPGEAIVTPTKTAFTLERYRHKLFDFPKDTNVVFSFDHLPADIHYSFYEDESSYIVDIYSTNASIHKIEVDSFSNMAPYKS